MKYSTFLLLSTGLLLSCFPARSQSFTLGVRGGFSIPNLTAGGNSNPISTGYSSRLGPDFAISGEFKLSNLFSLQPMVEYSSQGGKKDGLQALTTPSQVTGVFPLSQIPQYLYADFKSKAELNYVMIPVLAKFGWNFKKQSPWRIYIDAGPFVGFLVSAKQVTSGESQFYTDPKGQQPIPAPPLSFDNTEDIKGQLHSTNVGIEGNVGLNYRFGPSGIFVEGGGNYGFLNIQKGSVNGKNNTGAATAVIGYSYRFGK